MIYLKRCQRLVGRNLLSQYVTSIFCVSTSCFKMPVSLKASSGKVTNPMINPKAGDSGLGRPTFWPALLACFLLSFSRTSTEETLTCYLFHPLEQIFILFYFFFEWKLPHITFLSSVTIGSLRHHDDDGNKDVTNLHIWLSKTIVLHALHVQFSFLTFRRRSRSFYDVKWPVLQACWRRDHMMKNVQFCLLSEALVAI